MHYNLVELLAHKKKKHFQKETRKATLSFTLLKKRRKHASYIIAKFTKPTKAGGIFSSDYVS